jgi:hypothetical protein
MKNYLKSLFSNIILIILIPILVPFFVYVTNFDSTPIGLFFRSALISIVLFVIFLILASIFFHDPNRRMLFSSLTFILLFLYGAIYDSLASAGSALGHHKILAPLFLVLIIALGFIIGKIKISRNVLLAVNIFSILFIVFQIFQLIPQVSKNLSNSSKNAQASADQFNREINPVTVTADHGMPDVYYIILDMYSRNDILQQYFSFDNSNFTNSLKDMGFFVADCSRCNYIETRISLASSLNMIYLQNASDQLTPRNTDPSIPIAMIQDSTVIQLSKSLGYEINTFETGFHFTEIKNVDHYLQPQEPIAFLGSIQPYENLLLKYSIFKILYDTHLPLIDPLFNKLTFPYYDHVKLQNFIFDNLISLSTNTQPSFTFAHITIPHTPFIFRADGTFTTDRRYFSELSAYPVSNELFVEGYTNQLEYVNQKILNVVKEIISNSSTPPIIIIQGDHGAILDDRLPVLNAYYFPGLQDSGLYSSISPVNSYRLLFDKYFNGDYPILQDQSYNSSYEFLYDWTQVAESSPACINQ